MAAIVKYLSGNLLTGIPVSDQKELEVLFLPLFSKWYSLARLIMNYISQ